MRKRFRRAEPYLGEVSLRLWLVIVLEMEEISTSLEWMESEDWMELYGIKQFSVMFVFFRF